MLCLPNPTKQEHPANHPEALQTARERGAKRGLRTCVVPGCLVDKFSAALQIADGNMRMDVPDGTRSFVARGYRVQTRHPKQTAAFEEEN